MTEHNDHPEHPSTPDERPPWSADAFRSPSTSPSTPPPPPPPPPASSNSPSTPYGAPAPPPDGQALGQYSAMQPPPGHYYGYPPGYYGYPVSGPPVKQPRPSARLGGSLTVLGGVLMIVSAFLPWAGRDGQSFNGMNTWYYDLDYSDSPGIVMILVACVPIGIGVASFVAGRILALGIIAVVSGVLGALVGVGMIGIAQDAIDILQLNWGIGLIMAPIVPLISALGGVITLAKK